MKDVNPTETARLRWMNPLSALAIAVAVSVALIAAMRVAFKGETRDYVFDANGQEVDCKGRPTIPCVAASCPHGYEQLEWHDLGGRCTYRCKP